MADSHVFQFRPDQNRSMEKKMLRKMTTIVAALALVALFSSGPNYAQEGDSPTAEETTLTNAAAPDAGSVFLIVCDSKPNQIIVLDSTGKWIPTIRTASIALELGKPPEITCVMWSGAIKPTSPETKKWTLAQMKSVDAATFQKHIDALQTDPSAIARGTATPDTSPE